MSGVHDPALLELLDGMRQRFALIDRQMVGLQADISSYTAKEADAAATPPPQPDRQPPLPQAAVPRPVITPEPVQAPPMPLPPGLTERGFDAAGRTLRRYRGGLSLSDFLGLRALAWVGGVITLLGIAFFYILADQNGWVGPGGRVLMGAGISTGLLGLAWWLRRLKGQPEAALAAAGTGIAGLYVTLFAATKLYHYVSIASGMPLALAIAGLAVAIALAWSTESLALLGLTGAALAPPMVEGTISPVGVAFAGVVAAASVVLWVGRDWRVVGTVGSAVTVPQLAWLVAEQRGPAPALGWNEHWQTVTLAGCFWALYVAAGFTRYLRSGRLDHATISVLASTSTSAIAVAAVLFDGNDRGWAMLAVAVVYGALACVPGLLGRPSRDLSSLLGATALAAALVATGELLGGGTRAVAVSAEAGLMVWLSSRFGERRFQVASLAYLAVACAMTLVLAPAANLVEFPPRHLVGAAGLDGRLLIESVASAVALAIATVLFALLSVPIRTERRTWRRVTAGAALSVSLYAAAQAILDCFMWLHFTQRSFENGHTVVSLVIALVGVALLVVGLRRHSTDERTAGLILLGGAVSKLFLYDLVQLNLMARAVAFIAVGLLLLAGGITYQRLWDDDQPQKTAVAA